MEKQQGARLSKLGRIDVADWAWLKRAAYDTGAGASDSKTKKQTGGSRIVVGVCLWQLVLAWGSAQTHWSYIKINSLAIHTPLVPREKQVRREARVGTKPLAARSCPVACDRPYCAHTQVVFTVGLI